MTRRLTTRSLITGKASRTARSKSLANAEMNSVVDVHGADAANYKILSDFIDKEVSDAWARKSSFETRSFSIVMATISLISLYFVLQTQLKLSPSDYQGWVAGLFVTSLIASFVALVCAVAAALPMKYPLSPVATLEKMLSETQISNIDHSFEILEARIDQLAHITARNSVKAFFAVSAFASFFLAGAMLVATLAVALLTQ